MDRDTIIELAREAGLLNILEEHHNEYGGGDFDGAQYEELEHFAALVAAHEREACAKVCDELRKIISVASKADTCVARCAITIRRRSRT